jgi:AcrR family transcriptional regulator
MMTRARAGDYEDKKQLILDQAAEIFARKGFESATMIEVAQACGTSKSHLYYYFPSKEDLLFAILSEHIAAQADGLATIANMPLPVEERFNRFVAAFIERGADSRNQHVMLMNDLKFLPEKRHAHIRKLEIQLVEMMTRLLSELNPAVMGAAVRAPYSLMVYGMMIWTLRWYNKDGAIPPSELAARIAQLLVHGFKDASPL